MIKLLHLEIHDICEHCPYLKMCSISYGVDSYYCDNPDAPSDAPYMENTDIPEWCPLRTWVEGDKF